MTDNQKVLKIGDKELPQTFAAKISFQITRSFAKYLLIVADREDGMLDLILLQRVGDVPVLLAQRVLPVDLQQNLKARMTGAILQQIRLRHKLNTGNEQTILRDYSSIFRRTDVMEKIFHSFHITLSSGQGYSIKDIHRHVDQLVEHCELNLTNYQNFFSKRPQENTMLHLFNGMFMEWNSIFRMIEEFLAEQDWDFKKEALQTVMCGSSMQLAALAEPSIKNATSAQYTSSSKQRIYQAASGILHSSRMPNWDLTLLINQYPYEEKVLEAYDKYLAKANKTVHKKFSVFQENMLCLPASAGVYGGSLKGKLHHFNGWLIHSEENWQLVAPFSEEFSTLLVKGQAEIVSTTWKKTDEGWLFVAEFEYQGKKYRPRPKLYQMKQLQFVEKFPAVVMFKRAEDACMQLYMQESNEYQIQLYQGEKKNGVVYAPQDSAQYYFKITSNSQYLGQVAYSRKGGVK